MSNGPAECPAQAQLDPATARTLLRAFLHNVPCYVFFKDGEGRFVAVSDRKATRHGMAAADLIGKTDADFFSEEHTQWARADEESIIATGEPMIGRIEKTQWQDGRQGWGRVTKMALRNDKGVIVGTFGITYDVTEAHQNALELEKTRRHLLDASRLAGMAEIATGVLHNVGNVLTSLNVSADVLAKGLRHSKVDTLSKLAALLQEHSENLAAFIVEDPKGKRVPEFLGTLSQHMVEERDRLARELTSLQENIDHIKEIITMQQAYATMAGVVEPLDVAALVEDAIRMNAGALIRHSVAVVREFHPCPRVRGERAKVLQILVNLIRNAKYAADDGGAADKKVTLRVIPGQPGRVLIVVQDNGIGISAENMPKLFQHGFTTRSAGHGFGLHSARQAALDLHGALTAQSDGIGTGATFTLDLPVMEEVIPPSIAADGPTDSIGSAPP
jgi:PAS domain S-box-containing protein